MQLVTPIEIGWLTLRYRITIHSGHPTAVGFLVVIDCGTVTPTMTFKFGGGVSAVVLDLNCRNEFLRRSCHMC